MPVGAGLGLERFFGLAIAVEAGWSFSLSAVGTPSLNGSQHEYSSDLILQPTSSVSNHWAYSDRGRQDVFAAALPYWPDEDREVYG